MTANYRPLPVPPAPAEGQTMTQYGLVLFGFTLAHDCLVLSDGQIDLALTASLYAITAPDLLDSTRDTYTRARRRLAADQDRRRRAALVPEAPTAAPDDDRPNQGPMAWLEDAPRVQPPGGAAVAIEREDRREYARFDI